MSHKSFTSIDPVILISSVPLLELAIPRTLSLYITTSPSLSLSLTFNLMTVHHHFLNVSTSVDSSPTQTTPLKGPFCPPRRHSPAFLVMLATPS